jgi:HD-GYP domain-containing protein (c-di-GMP phosphodiesterase class II)
MTDNEHSRKVSTISGIVARYAGYPPDATMLIRRASLFHDFGKTAISQEILSKPSKLTAREFEIVKTHTQLGSQKITDAIRILTAAKMIAEQHHEKINGSGYLGLHGNEISPCARIVAVADVFDALISKDRPYKPPWALKDVIRYFENYSGELFDAKLVSVLLKHVDEIAGLYRK